MRYGQELFRCWNNSSSTLQNGWDEFWINYLALTFVDWLHLQSINFNPPIKLPFQVSRPTACSTKGRGGPFPLLNARAPSGPHTLLFTRVFRHLANGHHIATLSGNYVKLVSTFDCLCMEFSFRKVKFEKSVNFVNSSLSGGVIMCLFDCRFQILTMRRGEKDERLCTIHGHWDTRKNTRIRRILASQGRRILTWPIIM